MLRHEGAEGPIKNPASPTECRVGLRGNAEIPQPLGLIRAISDDPAIHRQRANIGTSPDFLNGVMPQGTVKISFG